MRARRGAWRKTVQKVVLLTLTMFGLDLAVQVPQSVQTDRGRGRDWVPREVR